MIDRRTVVAGGVAAASAWPASAAATGRTIPVWPGAPPGGGGPSGELQVSARGAVSGVAMPSLELFHPARGDGRAVLIAAGGGYRRIEIEAEARPAALWAVAHGLVACVLTYRLPGEGWAAGPLAPLQDAQRALRLMRSGAVPGVDPARISALGFSAGGHLMGLAATRSAFAAYTPVDGRDAASARPGAAALVYPVITLQPPYDHTSTRRALIGMHPSPSQSAGWSVETHVRRDCPPIFLVQALDDPVSDPRNSELMAQACRAAGVPVELHQLASGGHGFALGSPGSPTAAWPGWWAAWLAAQRAAST